MVRARPLTRALVALALVAGGAAAARAQAPDRVYRIGFVGFQSPGLENRMIAYFQERLLELDYVEGRNLSTSYRWADGEVVNYEGIARDLVRQDVDVIVAPCGAVVRHVRKERPSIPIVVRSADLTTCDGEIASAERPGGSTTGAIYFSPEATARRLQILQELLPGLSRVAVLYRPMSQWAGHWHDVDAAARAVGVRIHRIEWTRAGELAAAFDSAVQAGAGALLTLGDGATWFNRHHLFELAAERMLPVLYDVPMFPAPDVGLMSYTVETRSLFRHVAEQVDQILKGTPPGEIPLARPQQFQLFINTEAAGVLKLTIPPSLLRRNHTTEELRHVR